MSFVPTLGVLLGLTVLGACSSSTVTTPATGKIGDACPNGNSDCSAGHLCAGEDPGGGQCYKQCAPSKDSDCGDTTKYACSHEGHCYLLCKETKDCARASQGYVCKDDEPARGVKFCDVP
jgi:hypothetical protein